MIWLTDQSCYCPDSYRTFFINVRLRWEMQDCHTQYLLSRIVHVYGESFSQEFCTVVYSLRLYFIELFLLLSSQKSDVTVLKIAKCKNIQPFVPFKLVCYSFCSMFKGQVLWVVRKSYPTHRLTIVLPPPEVSRLLRLSRSVSFSENFSSFFMWGKISTSRKNVFLSRFGKL